MIAAPLSVPLLSALSVLAGQAEPGPSPTPPGKLSDHQTVRTATPAELLPPGRVPRPVFLGLRCRPADRPGPPVVEAVLPDSPAENGRVLPGDEVLSFNGREVSGAEELKQMTAAADPGAGVELRVRRDGRVMTKTLLEPLGERPAPPAPAGPPFRAGAVFVRDAGGAVAVRSVEPGSPAEAAGLRPGDRVTAVDGRPAEGPAGVLLAVLRVPPGGAAAIDVLRDGTPMSIRLARPGAAPAAPPHPARPPAEPVARLRLAVIGIAFADAPHNPDWKPANWEDLLFSRNKGPGRSPTGEPTFGSAADWFAEQSAGRFELAGRFAGWVPMPVRKAAVSLENYADSAWPRQAIELAIREGRADPTAGADAVCLLTAGPLSAKPGAVLWPHQGRAVLSDGRSVPYIVVPEHGRVFPNISVFVHEIGHLLGLPDQYGSADTDSLGVWCTMAAGHKGGAGAAGARPNHLCGWCKMRLGWLRPTPLDPSVPRHLLLRPVAGSADEAFQILLQPDGSEYLLLENRARRGFDADLPASGLLIWRVTDFSRVELEPAHGLRSAELSLKAPERVPFPQPGLDRLTPTSVPSGRAKTPNGRDAHLTQIRRHPGGEITFASGFEFF